MQTPTLLRNRAGLALALCLLTATAASQVSTEHAPGRNYFSATEKFAGTTGPELYETVCQGCHMAQGRGAVGAGAYPALAANKSLASATYLTYMVIHGRKAMPPFGAALDDNQIAVLVNYLRSSFGNAYGDTITAADVKSVRGN